MSSFDEIRNEEAKNMLSRRSFLKGTAVMGVAAMGTTVLSGCAPDSTQGASNQETPGTAAAKSSNADPIAPVSVPAAWTKEADIVIVGTGGGGLAAAAKAAEAGASVIAVEKLSSQGGGSQEAGLFFCFGGTRYMDAIKFALPTYPFDPDALVKYVLPFYQWSMDPALLRALAVKGGECINWLGDIGVEWELDIRNGEGLGPVCHVWKGSTTDGNYVRAMKPVTDHVFGVAKEKGVDFMFETTVEALVKDGDRIVGIKAKNLSGDEIFLRGKKAVILTAGGFAMNKDMLEKYVPTAAAGCAVVTGMPCDTGECVRMGLGAGADMSGFNSSASFDGGLDWAHEGGALHHYLYDGSHQLVRQPWLGIDRAGNRYPYLPSEPATNLGDLATIQMSLPGKRAYVFWDAHYEEYINGFKQGACRKPITPDMTNIDRVPETHAPHDWRKGVEEAIQAGAIKKADTIEELAGLLELDKAVVKKAVEDWNAVCKAGVDTLPNYPMPPEWLHPIADPPFYGARIGGMLFATKAGLLVTPEMKVVNTEGKVIPGLYAGFHTAGGGCGENCYNGNPGLGSILADVGLSFTGGYIAAENALNEKA